MNWTTCQQKHNLSNQQIQRVKQLKLTPKKLENIPPSFKSVGSYINYLWNKQGKPKAINPELYKPTTVATSMEHFLRVVAFHYIKKGYIHVVVKDVTDIHDKERLDRRVIEKYRYAHRTGNRSIWYMRYKNTAILLATPGKHPDFDKLPFIDVSQKPVYLGDYSIGFRGENIWVQLSPLHFKTLRQTVESASKEEALKLIGAACYISLKGINVQRWSLSKAFNNQPKNNHNRIKKDDLSSCQ